MDTYDKDLGITEKQSDITARDWFDIIGQFLYRLGVTAAGFGLVIIAATMITKLVLIPILRAKGWCV